MLEATPVDLFDAPTKDVQYYELPGINSQWVIENAQKKGGCTCPLCKQRVKVYPRAITAGMVHTLIMLYNHFMRYPRSRPVHVDTFLTKVCREKRPKGNNHSLLVHWGLLDRLGTRVSRAGQKRDGYYNLTEKGILFCERKISVPLHVFMYNNAPVAQSPEKILINDVKHFDYEDLMSAEPFESLEFV